jgi:lactoylglutathione lyase
MRLHHAGISVPDLDRALDWYCQALGLTRGFCFEVPPLGLRGAFALGHGGSGVELLEQAGAVPGPPKADPPSANAVHGLNHACFQVDDLDAAYARAVGHGGVGVWSPRDSPEPGMRMAYLTDPDGNLIELIQEIA